MPDSRLSHDGNLDGTPGAALTFPHVFTAGSRGSLRLSSSAASSPPAQNWSDALYQDANCNGQIDADTDALIDPKQAFELDAGQNLCLVHKQFIPTDAATGHRNIVTLRAELAYANAAPTLSAVYTREDRTTVAQSGALELVKEVRHTGPNCAPLPSPQGDWSATTRRGLATGCNIASRTATRISIPCGTWSSPMPRRPSRATSARPAAPARPTAWSARRPAPTAIPSAPKTGTAGILRWDFRTRRARRAAC